MEDNAVDSISNQLETASADLTAADSAVAVNYFNVSDQVPIDYAIPLYGYIMPVILVATCLANTMTITVLIQKHMRSPTNYVLLVMSISDLLTIIFPSPWMFYLYTLGWYVKPLGSVVVCYAYTYMNDTLPNMFHTASIWLTLALAAQRYIYVCHAPVARIWCTMPRVQKTVIIIYISAFLHQCTRFFDRSYFSAEIQFENKSYEVCVEEVADWVQNVVTPDIYYNCYYWFRVICVHTFPCIILVLLNVLLCRTLKKAQAKRGKLLQDNKKESKKQRDSRTTTLMLVVVVTLFLSVEIPLAVVTLLHIISAVWVKILNYELAKVLIILTNFIILVSHPINFLVYCGMSRQFRDTFHLLFTNKITYHQNKRKSDTMFYPRSSQSAI